MTIASTAPTLMGEALSSLWIAIPVLSLFALAELLYHLLKVETEYTRKLSHLGSGLVVFCMPWAVSSHWTVLALAGGFAVILGGSKALGLLPSVHSVSRRTSGAIYYPFAVYFTYLLADGQALLFQVPILVMALSDTGAAVVGKRYGIVRYRVIEDYRSLGGSTTFFGLTFAVVLVALGLAGYSDLPSVLIITLLTATLTTAVEAVSVRGADNILVPYVTFLVLRATLDLPREVLGDWVLGTALVLAGLLATYRQSRLNATGFLAALLVGALAWGIGGPVWLATLAVPYLGLAAAGPVSRRLVETDLEVVVPALAVSALVVLAFAHLGDGRLFVPFLGSVAAMSSLAFGRFARERLDSSAFEAAAGLVAALAVVVPALTLGAPTPLSPTALIVALAGAWVAPLVRALLESRERSSASVQLYGVAGGTSGGLVWFALQVLA